MRVLAALLFCASTAGFAITAGPIDLDQSGVLEALRTDDPTHYARILAIIRNAEAGPDVPTSKSLQSTSDARDVRVAPLWMVSNPPKLSLTFRLDETRYTKTIVARYVQPKLTPAR